MKHNPTGLAHVGIPCSDVKKSVAFYEQFGFKTVASGENLSGFHIAMVRLGDCTLELYQSVDPSVNDVANLKNGHVDHVALAVDNLEGLYEECLEKGIPVVTNGIESIGVWAPKECHYFIIVGPDGERIEFAHVSD
jgi:lactoylglutathione lyase